MTHETTYDKVKAAMIARGFAKDAERAELVLACADVVEQVLKEKEAERETRT